MKFKKRTAVIAVAALLVCGAVYLDWSYQKGIADEVNAPGGAAEASDEDRLLGQLDLVNGTVSGQQVSATSMETYFAQLRLTRQKARDEAISILEKTTADENVASDAKEIAVSGISAIANNAVVEARIEGLILSKGYSDCAVFLNDEGISVIVAPPSGGMKVEDAVRIQDIAVSETSVKVENIRIIGARVG